MIPQFDETGNLPPGIHLSTFEEFQQRFVYNKKRKELHCKLLDVIILLRKFSCRAVFIDGSYVSSKVLPSDIDLCWDDEDVNFQFVQLMAPDILLSNKERKAKFGIDVFPAEYFLAFFQKDKQTEMPKGIIKIEIS
jgi:hypothetical protein